MPYFRGTEGDDVLDGSSIGDVLLGDGGNDTLNGYIGADLMRGGTGDDTYYVDNAGDQVVEGQSGGNDTVNSSVDVSIAGLWVENLYLIGWGDIDGYGNGLDNTIVGNDANNRLNGGAGSDQLLGGEGDDIYYVDNVGDKYTERWNEGYDYLFSNVNVDLGGQYIEYVQLTGSGNISAIGNGVGNVLKGNAGNNLLDGRLGADQMAGGAGDDTYYVDNLGDTVSEDMGEGHDQVFAKVSFTLTVNVEGLVLQGTGNISGQGNGSANRISGQTGNNTLSGGGGDDHLIGHAGHDLLDGGAGNDRMQGGVGNDTYVVDSRLDKVIEYGGGGSDEGGIDTVWSSVDIYAPLFIENVTLGGTGNLRVTGNDLNNVLIGNTGNNQLTGGGGTDKLYGGSGNDTYIVHLGDVISEVLPGQSGDSGGDDLVVVDFDFTLGSYFERLLLSGIEALDGSGNGLDNTLNGNLNDNILLGLGGSDELNGNAGNDTLEGGSGNDLLDGGMGQDTMYGGAGSDTYFVEQAGDVVSEALLSGLGDSGGYDQIYARVNCIMSAYVEELKLLGAANINGTGNAITNQIYGNSGANSLSGLDGDDRLFGDEGRDTLFGDNGRDILNGENGDDQLHGGAGIDHLNGGAGVDSFCFDRAGPDNGKDQLLDFTSGTDKLQFAGAEYGFAAGHVLTVAEFHVGGASGTGTQFFYRTSDRTLFWDVDGTGSSAAIAIAGFNNGAQPVAGDFVFI